MTPAPGRSRPDRFDLLVALVGILGGATLLWMGRGLTFFWDEWEFIENRALTDVASWFRPHNEHWSTLPIVAYRLLVETVGLRTYVPYLALLVALHLVVVGLVYLLVRRRSGWLVALGAAVLMLWFGSGFENLFWAFQIGFLGTTALTLAALVILDGPPGNGRALLLALIVLAALMTTGLGLATLAVMAVELVLRPPWRRDLWLVLVAVVVLAAWFVAIGRTGLGVQGDPFSLQSLMNVPLTIVQVFGGAAGGISGLGPVPGIAAAAIVVGYMTWLAVRGRVGGDARARVVSTLLGMLCVGVIVGLSRTAHPEGSGDSPRLVYFCAALLIVGLSAAVGTLGLPASGRARLAALAAIAIWIAVTATWNGVLLLRGQSLFAQRADITRGLLALELDPSSSGRFDPNRPLVIVPSANALERIVDRYGSPLADALVQMPPISADARAKAAAYLFDGGPIPAP